MQGKNTKQKDKKLEKTYQKSGLNISKMTIKQMFANLKDCILEGIFPDDCNCILCDKEIAKGSKYGLCEDCYNKMPFNNGRICVRCGAPMDNEASYCLECQNHIKHFDFARSSLVYEGDAQKLILNMKFHNCRWLAKYFAQMMFDTYTENHLDAELIIPVPISAQRFKERGYNQSELIAKELAKKLGLPMATNVVAKIKDNKRQANLSGRDRRENVVGAYKIENRSIVKGLRILLVDDILTTGSTLSEVSRKLKIAGASAVYGLVIASPHYKVPSENDNNSNDFLIAD